MLINTNYKNINPFFTELQGTIRIYKETFTLDLVKVVYIFCTLLLPAWKLTQGKFAKATDQLDMTSVLYGWLNYNKTNKQQTKEMETR